MAWTEEEGIGLNLDTDPTPSPPHTHAPKHTPNTQAARAAALRLAIAREQEAAQETAALAQSLLREERRGREKTLNRLACRLRRYAAARLLGLVGRAETQRLERAWVRVCGGGNAGGGCCACLPACLSSHVMYTLHHRF
jgi:hypothetical protein